MPCMPALVLHLGAVLTAVSCVRPAVSLRFLHECPWRRLEQIREAVPNIPLQVLQFCQHISHWASVGTSRHPVM
jgi:hypothetical protein